MRFEDADKGWMEKRLRRFVVRRWFSGVGSVAFVQRRWFSGVGSAAFAPRRLRTVILMGGNGGRAKHNAKYHG